jgi:hypothetical protein
VGALIVIIIYKEKMIIMFTNDYNKVVEESNLYTINADQPIRHK